MATKMQDWQEAIKHSYSAVGTVPTVQGDVSVASSSALLFANAASTDNHATRSVTIQNTEASGGATIGIKFVASTDAGTGHALTTCFRLEPKAICEFLIRCNIGVVAVSSSGTVTANVLVLDQGQ